MMMMWRDEDDRPDDPFKNIGKPGGDWHGIRPRFDNPMTWAFRIFTVGGIDVRIHIAFILFVIIILARPIAGVAEGSTEPLSLSHAVITMGALFVVVLVHEFGHCLACRYVGGSADEILMWPLGGLAYCQPGHEARNHLITVIGGPAVNVLICALAMPFLGIATGEWWGVAIPNPLNIGAGLHSAETIPLQVLYLLNAVSFLLLLFNLLPIFPFDGGRILQALLWPSKGYTNSMRFATRTGLIGAILLGIIGAVMADFILLGIAVFGGLTCYITAKQVEFTAQYIAEGVEDYAGGYLDDDDAWRDDDQTPRPRKPTAAERRQARRISAEIAEADQAEAILQKIADHGMDSLTAREKKLLDRVSERKRKQASQ